MNDYTIIGLPSGLYSGACDTDVEVAESHELAMSAYLKKHSAFGAKQCLVTDGTYTWVYDIVSTPWAREVIC